ncbi:MAG: GNAT family N-acetyltransferase [Bacteriovoracaceae bacterium]|nr:GNAT family N-acetyltransferase [Bacteriovoracaceae bacterium]
MKILEFSSSHIQAVKNFTDRWIGQNYYSLPELKNAYLYSQGCSYLAYVDEELAGIRLTYAPGDWIKSQRGLSFHDWKVPSDRVGYFKSLFVAEKFQQLGIGRKLAETSLKQLQKKEAQAVICHSWLESPGNSSQLYLEKMGFVPVKSHPEFWKEIDYLCTRCSPHRCLCTAIEMIKYL